MSKSKYEGAEEYKPISSWGYVGYSILFAIPILGQILLIVFSFSKKNINRRNFARHFWCYLLIAIIFFLGSIVLTRLGAGNLTDPLKRMSPTMRQVVETIENIIPSPQGKSSSNTSVKVTKETTSLNSTSKSTTTEKSKATEKPASSTSKSSTGVRKEVKDAIDGYEKFFKEYADFMKKYTKSSDPLSMMSDYTKMMSAYAKNMEAWEKFDKKYNDMNNAELKYYTDATLRIEKLLLSAF